MLDEGTRLNYTSWKLPPQKLPRFLLLDVCQHWSLHQAFKSAPRLKPSRSRTHFTKLHLDGDQITSGKPPFVETDVFTHCANGFWQGNCFQGNRPTWFLSLLAGSIKTEMTEKYSWTIVSRSDLNLPLFLLLVCKTSHWCKHSDMSNYPKLVFLKEESVEENVLNFIWLLVACSLNY